MNVTQQSNFKSFTAEVGSRQKQEMRSNMTPADWRQYALRLRANHWHELFDSDDARRDLTWKGRFASITNAINYYSVGEDVLNNSDGTEQSLFASDYAWANQEMRKGVWPAYLPGNNEAGWSFNAAYEDDDSMTPTSLATLPDSTLKQIPVFGEFDDMSICTTNLVLNVPAKNQLLADAIPAESYAAGRNPIQRFSNVEMQSKKTGGSLMDWTHSFILEAPYCWTHEVFLDILSGERQ